MKWKRPKAATLLVLVFAAAAVFLGWRLVYPPEPAYLGKPLSAWVRQFSTKYLGGVPPKSAAEEAQRAIQHIGAEALPILLRQMRASDSSLRKKLRATVSRNWHDRLGLQDKSGEIRRLAAHGIHAL